MKKRISMFMVIGLVVLSVKTVWGATEGANNSFFGDSAGATISTGHYNSFFGASAGYKDSSGGYNTFLGYAAGWSNSSGSYNSFLGYGAGYFNTIGINNNFFGRLAGYNNITGSNNNFFGSYSGYNNTVDGNSFFGDHSGFNNTTGYSNSFFGRNAGYSNTDGHSNSFFGGDAGYSTTTGDYNAFLGAGAGYSNTTGGYNTFLGYRAGYNNIYANFNTFVGYKAGNYNTTAGANTYIGHMAGSESTGGGNTFIGFEAGEYNTGENNVFIGKDAGLYEYEGSNMLYISNSETETPLIYGEFDNQYLKVNGDLNVSGDNSFSVLVNQAIAIASLDGYVSPPGSGVKNVGVVRLKNTYDGDLFGFYLRKNSAGQSEVLLSGYDASAGKYRNFAFFNLDTTTYEIRDGVGDILFRNTGNIGIGTTTPSHLIELAGGAYSDGSTWVNASSRELKENIQDISAEEAINTIEKLKPVAFNYKKDNKDQHVGFIAEDVPELVATVDRKGLEAMDIVAVLTKVVQEMRQEHKKEIQELQKIVNEQQTKIGQLETALQFKQDKNADLAQAN